MRLSDYGDCSCINANWLSTINFLVHPTYGVITLIEHEMQDNSRRGCLLSPITSTKMDRRSFMQFCSHQQMYRVNPETIDTDIFSDKHLFIFREFKNKNPSV